VIMIVLVILDSIWYWLWSSMGYHSLVFLEWKSWWSFRS